MKTLVPFVVAGSGILACSCGSTAPATDGHALVLDVALNIDNGDVSFLSPSNTIIKYPASQIVGKPFLVGTFHAGFSPGNDPPIDHVWGIVAPDLRVHYATPHTYVDGPYDIVFVIYSSTPITPAIESGPAQSAPAAKGGDLASFTLDTSAVHAGDPKNALGTIRLNVSHGDAAISLQNRVPRDPSDSAQTTAAFANTILTIP